MDLGSKNFESVVPAEFKKCDLFQGLEKGDTATSILQQYFFSKIKFYF